MARPSKFNREEAVETVMHEIWRQGYEANSVKALSEKLGITRSSFYNAFGSRDDLFKEVLTLYLQGSPDSALTNVKEGTCTLIAITNTFRAACKIRAADPENRGCLAINSVTELCNVHDTLGALLEDMMLGNIARIETLLKRAKAKGSLPQNTDTRALALALKNLLIGLNVMCKVVRDENDLWLTAQTTLKALGVYKKTAHATI